MDGTVQIVTLLLTGMSLCMANPVHEYSPTIAQGWHEKKADIYFVLDTSASVWVVDFRSLAEFVAGMVEEMDIGPTKTRVGLATFEETLRPYISVDNTKSKAALVGMIDETAYTSGNGYLSVAVQGAKQIGLPHRLRRDGVPPIAVIFTDGVSRYKQLALDNATQAKEDGIFLMMVGIGNDVDRSEIRTMASDPKSMYYHYARSFDDLPSIRESLMASMAEVEYFQADEGTCGDTSQVDTVFVYDDYALSLEQSTQMNTLMKNAADRFSMGSGNVRLAAVCSTERDKNFMLGQYVRREKLKEFLDFQDQSSPLADLVARVTSDAYLAQNGARPYSTRRMVLVLDREVTTADNSLVTAIWKAKLNQIDVFIIQLGYSSNKAFIQRLATKPTWTFFVENLASVAHPNSEFFSRFCEDLYGVTRRVRVASQKSGRRRRISKSGSAENSAKSVTVMTWTSLIGPALAWCLVYLIAGRRSSTDET